MNTQIVHNLNDIFSTRILFSKKAILSVLPNPAGFSVPVHLHISNLVATQRKGKCKLYRYEYIDKPHLIHVFLERNPLQKYAIKCIDFPSIPITKYSLL